VQDEQERLLAALQSVSFCDETVVVDGGSSDRTIELARAAGATVIENPWPGFAIQRNVALRAASGEWIVEIDADERVSPSLRASIEGLLAAEPVGVSMAVCALRNRFLGRLLGPSAKYPAYRARVFRRDAYRHDESRAVHEGIEPRERPLVLDGDLEHELAATLHEALADTWRYARLESRHVGRPSTIRACLTGIVVRPTAKLVYRTVVDGGWRDGWQGMLKIALDAISDALVWTLALTRGRALMGTKREGERETETSTAAGESDVARAGAAVTDGARARHFGRRPVGPVKVVAVADHRQAARAARWLAGLRARGIDVALVCTERSVRGQARDSGASQADWDGGYEGIPLRAVKRLWPLTVIRALEIETQLRTIDAVVPVGRRARLVQRALPWTLRPELPGLDASLDPELASAGIARR
jgi:Glycosyl transferase family 2